MELYNYLERYLTLHHLFTKTSIVFQLHCWVPYNWCPVWTKLTVAVFSWMVSPQLMLLLIQPVSTRLRVPTSSWQRLCLPQALVNIPWHLPLLSVKLWRENYLKIVEKSSSSSWCVCNTDIYFVIIEKWVLGSISPLVLCAHHIPGYTRYNY